MRPETSVLIKLEFDRPLAAETLGTTPEELWNVFLDDDADIAPLLRKIMLTQMFVTWNDVRDELQDCISQMGAYELSKTFQALTSGITDLMNAMKPAGETNNNLFVSDEGVARLAQRMNLT